MKAVQFTEFGGVEVLNVVDLPVPSANDYQVVVKVKAAGLNPGEASIREGRLESIYPTKFPCGEGSDFAGVITEVGSDVTKFSVDDEVAGHADNRSSHSEYVVVKENSIISKPSSVPWEAAGSLWVAGTTAYAGVDAVGVKGGDTIVISGAAGGVGLIAAQLAKVRGATVIGAADKSYHGWLKQHGIIPVDYHGDIKTELNSAAGKVDAMIDTSGHGYVELAIDLGISKDRINTCIDFEAAGKYGVKTDGSAVASNMTVFKELIDLIADGKLELPVSRTFVLDDVRDAYNYLADNHDIGKAAFVMT